MLNKGAVSPSALDGVDACMRDLHAIDLAERLLRLADKTWRLAAVQRRLANETDALAEELSTALAEWRCNQS